MSKLIDRLKQLSDGAPQPMGFRTAQAVSNRPRIQLVVAVSDEEAKSIGAAGADAAMVGLSDEAQAADRLKSLAGVEGTPWGTRISGSKAHVDELVRSGADFVVFPLGAPLVAVLEHDIGKVIEVEASLGEGLLRALNSMPVDAVLVSHHKEKDYAITFDDLMLFQHLGGLLSKPLIVPVPATVSQKELQTLWEGGVDGILVDATGGKAADVVGRLRDVIGKLEYPSAKRKGRPAALAPHVNLALPGAHEEEEEEDDDE